MDGDPAMTARNGKGSARRGVSREELERYDKGWDAIFRPRPLLYSATSDPMGVYAIRVTVDLEIQTEGRVPAQLHHCVRRFVQLLREKRGQHAKPQ